MSLAQGRTGRGMEARVIGKKQIVGLAANYVSPALMTGREMEEGEVVFLSSILIPRRKGEVRERERV